MSILDEIVAVKVREVEQLKAAVSYGVLESSPYFHRKILSMRESLLRQGSSGIIAEFKRRSPSKGLINDKSNLEDVVKGYAEAGAPGISVLTDQSFFGGSTSDLTSARKWVDVPLLRKEFIIDEYQIIESKSLGADVILLIAAILSPVEVMELTRIAHALEMEVLLEVHNEQELEFCQGAEADLIGINNRNLKTFEVSLETSRRLFPLISPDAVPVSESGIEHPDKIIELTKIGYRGFLVGQRFMESESPGEAAQAFVKEVITRKLE